MGWTEDITVAITSKDRRDDLRTALRSTTAVLPGVATCVIDDGSVDGTSEMVVQDFPHVRLESYRASAGLIARRNELARLAKTKYLLSIDDDAELTAADSIQAATSIMDTHPRVAVVGVPFVNVGRESKVRQVAPDKDRLWLMPAFVGTAYVIRVDTFLEVGGYRAEFWRQGEETELSLRLIDGGWMIAASSGAAIRHYHSPNRDSDQIEYYARRSDVATAFLLWPARHLPFRLIRMTLRGLRRATITRRWRANLRGLVAGLGLGLHLWKSRTPVRRTTVRTFELLLRQEFTPAEQLGVT
jgi:GT2 family glycosyltransferase